MQTAHTKQDSSNEIEALIALRERGHEAAADLWTFSVNKEDLTDRVGVPVDGIEELRERFVDFFGKHLAPYDNPTTTVACLSDQFEDYVEATLTLVLRALWIGELE